MVAAGGAASACAAAIGAGVGTAAVGASIIAYQCYDQVQVSLYDRVTGDRICDADVFITDGNSRSELVSCYHISLTEGKWQLVAQKLGYVTASTELVVQEPSCRSRIQTIVLSMQPVGYQSPRPVVPKPVGPRQVPAPAPAPKAVPQAPVPVVPQAPVVNGASEKMPSATYPTLDTGVDSDGEAVPESSDGVAPDAAAPGPAAPDAAAPDAAVPEPPAQGTAPDAGAPR